MITFIDLFCGIGGFRLALEKNNAKCLFSAEINPHACSMYEANFGENPFCDITTIDPEKIPDFDILCAGFPCQAFSSAGKKLGFEDTRGTLFFDLCKIIDVKKPKVLLLENVKNLVNHDNGKTFTIIQEKIKELGYQLSWQILSAKDFGLPQHRERIIMVAVRNDLNKRFNFDIIKKNPASNIQSILEHNTNYLNPDEYTLLDSNFIKTQPKSGLIFCGYRNKNKRNKGVLENTDHLSRSHKQVNRIYDSCGIHPTLSSQDPSGRYFILHESKVRKLTLNECYRLMGFPDSFIKIGSQSNLYARVGNSVCVNVIDSVMSNIKKQIFN